MFHVKSYLAPCSKVFKSCLALLSPRLGKRELYASLAFVRLPYMRYKLSFSLPLGFVGLAADCDCDTSWTFHLTFRKQGTGE